MELSTYFPWTMTLSTQTLPMQIQTTNTFQTPTQPLQYHRVSSPTPPTSSPNAKPHLLQLLKGKHGFSSLEYKKQILCETCMVIIPTYQYEVHIEGQQHHKKLQQKRRPNRRITKVCDLCGWRTRERDYATSYEMHLTCTKHLRMLNWLKALEKG